ncbi:MAG: serine protein kinase PrkA [Deltaproteobacteria bacterium]|nr:serine protein kinase PrkA [Deltaproteobacteria bacterium]
MSKKSSEPSLESLMGEVRDSFHADKTIMSFHEFYQLICEKPQVHLRSSAQYMVDMMEHYGTESINRATGEVTRFKVFDRPFNDGEGRVAGQEDVQVAIHRTFSNFAREGRVNKLILLHGPNGSAKSSLVRALMAGLEDYSRLAEGAIYSFNWIFPATRHSKDSIGFGTAQRAGAAGESYAYLGADDIDARVPCEMHDHPLFLVPRSQRTELLEALAPNMVLGATDEHVGRSLSEYLRGGDLSYKSRRIFDALLASYDGDVSKVFNHIQVERIYLSRQYRCGMATIEPQMAVDARIQQLTADKSLAALPKALQHTSLYQPTGPLVSANRGLLEFSDFLKRPVDSFKYLLSTVETSTVTMDSFVLHLDMMFIASTNETYLDAFKQHPDFPSFKGRMELIKVPYLRHFGDERAIYDATITERVVGRHIAPHAVDVAALWAILTRMRRNNSEEFPEDVREVIDSLTPMEKLRLYDQGEVPHRLTTREARELRHSLKDLHRQAGRRMNYEGIKGASAREIRSVLLNAAYHEEYSYLSPLAVFSEIEAVLEAKSVYDFLKQEAKDGYHDHVGFLEQVRELFTQWTDDEICDSMGLASDESYGELFTRYISHVSHWVKSAKLVDPNTGTLEEPDSRLMRDIEKNLVNEGEKPEDFRRSIIAAIGARSLEKPNCTPDYEEMFKTYIRKLRDAFYAERREELCSINQNFLRYASQDRSTLDAKELKQVEAMLERLKAHYGYSLESARDAVAYLLRVKYTD